MAEITRTTTDPQTGHTLAHYKSGVIRDLDTARNLRGPTDKNLNPVLADPGGMLQRRYELAEQAAWNAANQKTMELIESGQIEYITVDKIGSAPAIAAVVMKLTELILLAKTGREAEGIIAPWMRLMGLGGHKVEFEGTITHEVTEKFSEIVRELREAIKGETPEAVDGRVIDHDPSP
jgi:hypothetical protein